MKALEHCVSGLFEQPVIGSCEFDHVVDGNLITGVIAYEGFSARDQLRRVWCGVHGHGPKPAFWWTGTGGVDLVGQ